MDEEKVRKHMQNAISLINRSMTDPGYVWIIAAGEVKAELCMALVEMDPRSQEIAKGVLVR